METRKYRVGINIKAYYRRLIICCLLCLLIGIGATLSLAYSYFSEENASIVQSYEDRISSMEYEHKQEITQLNNKHEEELISEQGSYNNLQEQYEELQRIHTEVIDQSSADFAILRKYWYVLRDGPNNGTLTLDLFRFADNECKKWDINPHWLWHMYEHESQWIVTEVNSRSGATGLGQALPSTGRSYWENVLGHGAGSFSTEMLKDPYVNIEITVAHLGRDLQNGATWKEAVRHYCGGGVDAYWNVVVGYAKQHGITLTESNYHYNDAV